ncbi:MAG: FtsX-like permease family protein [Actinomycetota bacterium]
MRLRSELRHSWRGLLVLTLITALFGGVVLVALAGARRTSTAVDRFLTYSGPVDGQVEADPSTFDAIARLPEVAYTGVGALYLASPTDASGAPVGGGAGDILARAIIRQGRERPIIVSGRMPDPARADEAVVNESAVTAMHVRIGSTIHLRGAPTDQMQAFLSGGLNAGPTVAMPDVRVVGVVRFPTDIALYPVPPDVTFLGTGEIFVTRAYFDETGRKIANFEGLDFKLKRGLKDLNSFMAGVRHITGQQGQVFAGSDAQVASVAAKRGTSLQAFALLMFAVIAAFSALIVVGQAIARQTFLASDDHPTLRALGVSRTQLFLLALIRAGVVVIAGMLLAIPIAYGLSAFTPIGLARRAEVAPGLSFDVTVLLGGAAAFALLFVARAAVSALRAARTRAGVEAEGGNRSNVAEAMARTGMSPAAVSGVRLALEPGRGRSAVPVRSTLLGTTVALAALVTALVFGFSLNHLSRTPVLAGWNWDLAIGNPHTGDTRAQTEPQLRADPDVAGFTATTIGGGPLGGHDTTIAGIYPVVGHVVPPLIAGRLPAAPDEIALGGIVLRAIHKKIGDELVIPDAHATLHIVGEVVLSPQIVNQQEQLGGGGVMTIEGVQALSPDPLPVNVFLVTLKNPHDQAAIGRLKKEFPGVVLPATAAPEIHNLQGVSSFPLVLASVLTLLAVATIAHTLGTSVRRRRRDLAILKTLGFVRRQVRAAVAWQASALVAISVAIGLPLGIIAGRWAWVTYAAHNGLQPVPVWPLLLLLLVPGALIVANMVAAVPGNTAARTEPALVLRTE